MAGNKAKGSPGPVSAAVSAGFRNRSQNPRVRRVWLAGVGTVKLLRRFVDDPGAVDAVVVVLATWFVLGGYVAAYAYVHEPGIILQGASRAGLTIVTAAWSVLTLYLFVGFARGLRAGRVWNRALPDGQTGTFAAALIFGAAWIVDQAFWSPVFGTNGTGLDSLFTPPHLVEMAAAAIMVSGPLRAAARRGEIVASPVTLTSTALLLSVLTFATQFVHPLIDPWPAADYEFRRQALPWIGENMGMAALLGWLRGGLLRAGLPAAVIEPYPPVAIEPAPERWTLDPDSNAREQLVRSALDDLGTPEALGRNPLARLPALSKGDSAAVELRALLVDVIGELAVSASPRDAESGLLLLDYYVKRVGSHEVIMERLHMSRPTYYRRLHHGFELVAGRIDQLSVANRLTVTESSAVELSECIEVWVGGRC